jgi:hypothetical protein
MSEQMLGYTTTYAYGMIEPKRFALTILNKPVSNLIIVTTKINLVVTF